MPLTREKAARILGGHGIDGFTKKHFEPLKEHAKALGHHVFEIDLSEGRPRALLAKKVNEVLSTKTDLQVEGFNVGEGIKHLSMEKPVNIFVKGIDLKSLAEDEEARERFTNLRPLIGDVVATFVLHASEEETKKIYKAFREESPFDYAGASLDAEIEKE